MRKSPSVEQFPCLLRRRTQIHSTLTNPNTSLFDKLMSFEKLLTLFAEPLIQSPKPKFKPVLPPQDDVQDTLQQFGKMTELLMLPPQTTSFHKTKSTLCETHKSCWPIQRKEKHTPPIPKSQSKPIYTPMFQSQKPISPLPVRKQDCSVPANLLRALGRRPHYKIKKNKPIDVVTYIRV